MSAGQIYDLGYKRYVGSRRSVGTRWTVIMRHQVASSWKTWWRFKIWLVAAALATAVASGVLLLASDKIIKMFVGMSGKAMRIADGLLSLSPAWDCKIGFIVSLTIGARVIAGDVQTGAFTFYFARSLRPRDYVIGKLVGLIVMMSLVMLGGPLVLAAVRLGLSESQAELIALLPVVPKSLAIGVLGTLIYAVVPLGFSALITNRSYAVALWAAYYLLIGHVALGLAFVTHPVVAALDLPTALGAVARDLFDVHLNSFVKLDIPISAALISIFAHVAAAIGLMFWRVRHAQQTGVGGAS